MGEIADDQILLEVMQCTWLIPSVHALKPLIRPTNLGGSNTSQQLSQHYGWGQCVSLTPGIEVDLEGSHRRTVTCYADASQRPAENF